VLKRIFGSKGYEAIGGWKRLYNEELHNLYSLPNIILMIKSRRVRWAGLVARMDIRIFVRQPEGKSQRGRLGG
jgi:hypothetical protein